MAAKRKNSKKQAEISTQAPSALVSPADMSSEALQHIIASAIIEAERIQKQQRAEQAEAELREWQGAVGYKEYTDSCKLWRGIKNFCNRLKCSFKICFIRKKYVTGDRATTAVTKMLIRLFFGIVMATFFLLSLRGVINGVRFFISGEVLSGCMTVALSFLLFVSACILRIVFIEVDKIEDRNYLFGVFASVISVVSTVIAIVAIAKGG